MADLTTRFTLKSLRLISLLCNESIEPTAVGRRKDNFILQVGEIERGRISHVSPTRQIQALL